MYDRSEYNNVAEKADVALVKQILGEALRLAFQRPQAPECVHHVRCQLRLGGLAAKADRTATVQ